MRPQIPWLRVFVEGVVIVGSILLAFGIDAWWDERTLQGDLSEALAAVRTELDANLSAIRYEAQIQTRISTSIDAILDEVGSVPSGGQVQVSDTLVGFALAGPTFDPATGALLSLTSSGLLTAIVSTELRSRLAALPGLMNDAIEDEVIGRDISLDFVSRSLLADVDLNRATASVRSVWSSRTLERAEPLPTQLMLMPVRRDIANALGARGSWADVAAEEYAALVTALEETIDLLDLELDRMGFS